MFINNVLIGTTQKNYIGIVPYEIKRSNPILIQNPKQRWRYNDKQILDSDNKVRSDTDTDTDDECLFKMD